MLRRVRQMAAPKTKSLSPISKLVILVLFCSSVKQTKLATQSSPFYPRDAVLSQY